LRQVGGFLWGPPVSSTNKTDCHDKTEILLKVALHTTKQTKQTEMTPLKRIIMTLFWLFSDNLAVVLDFLIET
jgi:hypothetical protein